MIEIDGSTFSGSGTILRYAAALATLVREPLHMVHIRARRPKPGLRPQHVQALRACCALSNGYLEGDVVDSDTITYHPGRSLDGGDFNWDIGTAGSTTMLALTVIPLALYAGRSCRFSMQGGLFQDFAPSAYYLREVFLPMIRAMGAEIELEIMRPGYVPRGGGHLSVKVKALKQPLKPIERLMPGNIKEIRAIAAASHLVSEKVGQRMATRCSTLLEQRGYHAQIQTIEDTTALQKGAVLLLWAETDTHCLLGADRAGMRGRSSESIAEFVVSALWEDLEAGATTDRHLADQLILFAALADGRTQYLIPKLTGHVQSNLWLVETILGTKTALKGNHLTINGIGLHPHNV